MSASGISEMRRPVKMSSALKICRGSSWLCQRVWGVVCFGVVATNLEVIVRFEVFTNGFAGVDSEGVTA